MTWRLALLAMAALAAQPAAAQDVDCDNAVSQAEMTGCAGLEWEALDAELNTLWPQVRTSAKRRDKDLEEMGGDDRPGYADTLLDAQRKWIAYRDAECEYEGYQARGGTMEPMLINMCLSRLTQQRIADFNLILENDNL